MSLRAARNLLLATLSALPLAGIAEDRAHDWLARIAQAAHRLDYDGTFVYWHDHQLEAMRIVHAVQDGRERERLVSLNGAPREIIRNDSEVFCYLPDEKSIAVEHRKADQQNFPALLPQQPQALDDHYAIRIGRRERIAGRMAQQVVIEPRDAYRYGYHLWADTDTGLLLRADLLGDENRVIERFLFTQLTVGGPITARALQPEVSTAGMQQPRKDRGEGGDAPASPSWTVTDPPRGFRLAGHMTRKAPAQNTPVVHLVYSDGLVAVSVFIEKTGKSKPKALQGGSRIGAVHTFGRQAFDHQITAVGEVPAETVARFAASVAPLPEFMPVAK